MTYSDDQLTEIFQTTKRIACIGFSGKPERASHYVSQYLAKEGFEVTGVNPGLAGKAFGPIQAVASMAEVNEPEAVDMIDVFRRSEHVLEVVENALAAFPNLKTIWMQLGVINQDAAQLAQSRGVTVIMDRCPMIELPRLKALLV